MQAEFQAKDIQKILNIPKHRYEYLKAKINIVQPEIEKGEGRGKVNRYSFKNLMEFAIIYTANELGMSPETIKNIMNIISVLDRRDKIGIYDPFILDIDFSINVVFDQGDLRIRASGKSISVQNQAFEDAAFSDLFLKGLLTIPELSNYFKKKGKGHDDAMQEWREKGEKVGKIINRLEDADGHVTINVSRLKKRILGFID